MKKISSTSLIYLGIVLVVIATVFWIFDIDTHSKYPNDIGDIDNGVKIEPSAQRAQQEQILGTPITINSAVHVKIEEKKASETPFRFDVEFIFNALSKVIVDDNGDVVVNHQTKDLLEAAFTQMEFDLSRSELEELQDLIRLGIAGKAGEQAAKIVSDYYDYRVAETSFMLTTYGGDLEDTKTNFEQILAIRRAELGYDVAERLYGLQEMHSRYMIESIQIQSNDTLSPEEKAEKQKLLSLDFESNKKLYQKKKTERSRPYSGTSNIKSSVVDR